MKETTALTSVYSVSPLASRVPALIHFQQPKSSTRKRDVPFLGGSGSSKDREVNTDEEQPVAEKTSMLRQQTKQEKA